MARFKLRRPLFGRSKTAASDELESSTALAGSCPQLKDPSHDHFVGIDIPSITEHDRSRSVPAPPHQRASIASLGNVDEDAQSRDHVHALMSPVRPALVLQEPTPPTSENPIHLSTHAPSPLASAVLSTLDEGTGAQHPVRATQGSVHSSTASPKHISRPNSIVDSAHVVPPSIVRTAMPRKIWVRRPGASATLVQVREDDLVDDVREMILRKYANSLGRTFDAPDMTLRIFTRADQVHARTDRVLGPEEDICRAIDAVYPAGQTVDEALLIDVPVRRTPKPSPRPHYGAYSALEDYRPVESGTDYFPPMPAMQPVLPGTAIPHHSSASQDHPRSMAVLTTGQLPQIPSPGSTRKYHHRPKYGRQHTSSPTIIQHNTAGAPLNVAAQLHNSHRLSVRPRVDSSASDSHPSNGAPPPAPALPTPPAPEAPPTGKGHNGHTPPTPSSTATSLNPNRIPRPKKPRKVTPDKSLSRRRDRRGSNASPPALGLTSISSMLDGSVPPINVLIVEDNSINLRVLEGLMKRLRVRWDSATNGQIAVDKWRKGGYHLILMDIQMPVMNGLQATKEIRRLEKVNGIGVFSGSTPSSPEELRNLHGDQVAVQQDKRDPTLDLLPSSQGIFKSPIIIVALTASSLQSDRHEALAAGCNDFLTKPVNMGWLERKVKEWGCMQALIDFDGWKRWRDINEKEEAGKSVEQKQKEHEKEEKQRIKMEKFAALQERRKVEEAARAKQRAVVSSPGSLSNSPTVNGEASASPK